MITPSLTGVANSSILEEGVWKTTRLGTQASVLHQVGRGGETVASVLEDRVWKTEKLGEQAVGLYQVRESGIIVSSTFAGEHLED